jgi:hypothetical protein
MIVNKKSLAGYLALGLVTVLGMADQALATICRCSVTNVSNGYTYNPNFDFAGIPCPSPGATFEYQYGSGANSSSTDTFTINSCIKSKGTAYTTCTPTQGGLWCAAK